VVGRRDHDAVARLLLLEHLAEVVVLRRLRELHRALLEVLLVDVAQRDLALARHLAQVVRAAHAGHADVADVHLRVGRLLLAVAELAARDPEAGGGASLEKLSAVHALSSHPLRYSRLSSRSASGALVHFRFAESHSSFLPRR